MAGVYISNHILEYVLPILGRRLEMPLLQEALDFVLEPSLPPRYRISGLSDTISRINRHTLIIMWPVIALIFIFSGFTDNALCNSASNFERSPSIFRIRV